MTFQTVTPARLAQSALTGTVATIYTVPIGVRAMVKNIDITNTTATQVSVDIHIVPSAGTASADNALFFETSVPANGIIQWEGVQVLNEGDTLQAKGLGVTIHSSGGEAR